MKYRYLLPLITTILCLTGALARHMDGLEVSYFITYVAMAIIGVCAWIVGASIDYELGNWE